MSANTTTGFTQDSTDGGRVTVYRSVITNTSKEMSCFSDFPFPEDFPNYLPHSLLLEYFRMYAQHFDLLRYIHFKVRGGSKCHSEKGCQWLQIPGHCPSEMGKWWV